MRWLREPLLHFAAAGALLFALHAWLNPDAPRTDAGRQVRIGAGEIAWLETTWRRQHGRAPTAEELKGLVSNLVREELLAREAREMKLDENDTIVRRRLAQKLEFLLQDTARLAEPSDEELRRAYEASSGAFLTGARVSFSHVYFRAERTSDAAAALPRLAGRSPADAQGIGDRISLDAVFRDVDEQAVAAAFGPQFAQALFKLEPGTWHGPIESGYGVHLVHVTDAQPARPRDFAEVRPLVLERWREEQRRAAEARYFERLMAKYEVIVDPGTRP